MESLFIWYYIPRNLPKGVPLPLNTMVAENFNPNSPMPAFDYPWGRYNHYKMDFPPEEKDLRLPDNLFFIVKKEKELLFDYLNWKSEYKVVSAEMLLFLQENQLNDGYETAKLTVVNTSGKEISSKKYFLLRFGRFDDDLIDFNEPTKKRAVGTQGLFLYPDMQPSEKTNREIFVLKNFCYVETLIFSENLRKRIKGEFYLPEIYSSQEYVTAYNGRHKL